MPEKLWPPPTEALASRQDELAAWWAWWRWGCRDLAHASVMPPPSSTVPATRASAVRDRVGFPGADFLRFNMYQVPQRVLPHMWQVEHPSHLREGPLIAQ